MNIIIKIITIIIARSVLPGGDGDLNRSCRSRSGSLHGRLSEVLHSCDVLNILTIRRDFFNFFLRCPLLIKYWADHLLYLIGYQITTMADRLIGNGDGADVSVDTNNYDGGNVMKQIMMMDGGVSDHTNGDQARWRREPVHLLFHQQGGQPQSLGEC